MKKGMLLLAVAVAMGGCTANKVVSAPNSPAAAGISPAAASPAASVAHTGAAISIGAGADKGTVTLQQVVDPAPAGSIFQPDAGKRFVATKLLITNTGSGSLTGDANINAAVQGSDGQSYTPTLASDITGCTNFDSGSYTLAAGNSVVGCVVFQIPTGVTVAKVHYNLEAGFTGDTGQWLNP